VVGNRVFRRRHHVRPHKFGPAFQSREHRLSRSLVPAASRELTDDTRTVTVLCQPGAALDDDPLCAIPTGRQLGRTFLASFVEPPCELIILASEKFRSVWERLCGGLPSQTTHRVSLVDVEFLGRRTPGPQKLWVPMLLPVVRLGKQKPKRQVGVLLTGSFDWGSCLVIWNVERKHIDHY